MSEDDDVFRLPETNKRIGSCPECGKNIWASDCILEESEFNFPVYRCSLCRMVLKEDMIIPF